MSTWFQNNWYWEAGVAMGTAYLAYVGISNRDKWAATPRVLVLAGLMIIIAIVAIVTTPPGRGG
jgi:hypothetical protein